MRCLLTTILFLSSSIAHSATILVPTDFPTIQQALNAATSGDEIVIEPGTYFETLTLSDINLTLRSQSGDPTNTILDGSTLASGTPLLSLASSNPITQTVEGLTLRNAAAGAAHPSNPDGTYVFDNCHFVGNGPVNGRPALSAFRVAMLDVHNCEFRDNLGGNAGAIIITQVVATIRHNLFQNNSSQILGNAITSLGGSVEVSITDNMFLENTGGNNGPIDINVGTVSAIVRRNTLIRNQGFATIHAFQNSIVEENVLWDNQAQVAILSQSLFGTPTVVRNNTIVGTRLGGGIRIRDETSATVEGNIVAFNEGDGIFWDNATGTHNCNNSFGNSGGNYVDAPAGMNNISLDPLFCDAATGDLTLSSTSPCLPANNACAVLIGALNMGCGTVPTEETTWGRLKTLFD